MGGKRGVRSSDPCRAEGATVPRIERDYLTSARAAAYARERQGRASSRRRPCELDCTYSYRGKRYRIRRDPASDATVDAPEFIDRAVEMGKPYKYTVVAVVEGAESLPSAEASVIPQDKFPPPAPVNVTAIAGVNSVELTGTEVRPQMKELPCVSKRCHWSRRTWMRHRSATSRSRLASVIAMR